MVRSGAISYRVDRGRKRVRRSLIILGSSADNSLTTLEFLQSEVASDIRAKTGIEIIVV
jgi:hypothetical protein